MTLSDNLDPACRRNIMNYIDDMRSGCSIVLTTHIMEEVEAVATRVGIMINGKFACIGSLQHLISRFGNYHVMKIKCSERSWGNVKKFLESEMPSAKMMEMHFGQSTCHLPKNPDFLLSRVFRVIEEKIDKD